MDKKEIEQKLKEFCIEEVDNRYSTDLDLGNLLNVAEKAFNLALELAVEKAKTNSEDCKIWNCEGMSINKQSILNLKL